MVGLVTGFYCCLALPAFFILIDFPLDLFLPAPALLRGWGNSSKEFFDFIQYDDN